MNNFNIYLAGGMSNMTFEESNIWREGVKFYLMNSEFTNNYNIVCCNPNDYYNFVETTYDSEREVMEFDLNKVRHSDLLLVNFNSIYSLGTMAEIAIAREHNIPVIGICPSDKKDELHPWQIEMCLKIFPTWKLACKYIEEYFLV